jgi:methionyl-tRNA formyltransferase
MRDSMKIIFLTTNDPLYLPAFFETVLDQRAHQTLGVHVVPPLYKNETLVAAVRKYARTFGLRDSLCLARRVARCMVLGPSLEKVCRRHGVPWKRADDVNAPAFLDQLHKQTPDVVVSVSCPQIFRRTLIALPPNGILNIHGAVLPHYRGVMPSFWMLANGEKRAGVSIYLVNEQIDAGELCAQEVFDIHPGESLDAFLQRSKKIAAELLLKTLARMESGVIDRQPLDLSAGSYFSWPDARAVARFRAAGRRVW